MTIYNGISFLGMFVLMAVAWAFSTDRKIVNFRVVLWGSLLQILTALFIFKVPFGTRLFVWINTAVIKVMDCAAEGTRFLFGVLALSPGQTNEAGQASIGFILAFQALPAIIFFSSLISILYFAGIMPLIIKAFATVFTHLMRISGAESLVATSNIFVGVEAALTVKPFLLKMTRSELAVVLTTGMATVASNILALYVFSLKQSFPMIAGHLISASLLSAPAALIMAKLIVPERERPETLGVDVQPYYSQEKSLFEAVINGANEGLKMIAGIAALLVAVLGLVALFDLVLSFAGGGINRLAGWNFDWSLRSLCGYVFYPATLIIGIPPSDAGVLSKIIGERLILTEVVSYQDLAQALANNQIQNPRSAVVATYALCGFAHVASMAIFIGGTAALAPERTGDMTRIALRSLLAATLAGLMTACVAGTFYTQNSVLFTG